MAIGSGPASPGPQPRPASSENSSLAPGAGEMHSRLLFVSTISLAINADLVSKDKHTLLSSKRRKATSNVLRFEARNHKQDICPPLSFRSVADLNASHEAIAPDPSECRHGEGCQKQATFGIICLNAPPTPMFCIKHALEGMVFTKRGRCRYFPTSFLSSRKIDLFYTDMMYIRYAEGCSRSPCYGISSQSHPLFCTKHRNQLSVIIDLISQSERRFTQYIAGSGSIK
jgi:hypothetical protein